MSLVAISRRMLVAVGALTLMAAHAQAFWENCTHPELAKKSVLLLDSARGGQYGEFIRADILDRLKTGASDEDKPFTRVVNHFYHAPDGGALNIPGVSNFLMDATECVC